MFLVSWSLAVSYSGGLGDSYTGLGSQTLVPKKHFSSFHFSVALQQNICWSSDQWFHNTSNYFRIASNTKMQTEEKNSDIKRSKPKKKLSTKVFSFICLHNITLLHVIHSVLLDASFKLKSLCSSHKLTVIQMFIWIYEIFKNHPWETIFNNVSLSNLEKALQRNLRTDDFQCTSTKILLLFGKAKILKKYIYSPKNLIYTSMHIGISEKSRWKNKNSRIKHQWFLKSF